MARRAVSRQVASVQRKRVRWLWRGRIPLAKLGILEGDPDLGKSTVALDLGARISSGQAFPDGGRSERSGDVVIMSAEDGLEDTIRPRLEAAGADLERIHTLEAVISVNAAGAQVQIPPVLPDHLSALETLIYEKNAVYVVIDMLAAYLSDKVDSYKDQEIRRNVLAPLAAIAERTESAIICLRHLNKSGGSNALYRGMGSIAIIGQARAGLMVAQDPDDEARRILIPHKLNVGAKAPALAYRVTEDTFHECSRISWEGTTHHRPGDLLVGGRSDPETPDEASALAAAMEFLTQELADGPLKVQEIRARMKGAGVTGWRTVETAKRRLGVIASKYGRPGDDEQGWQWSLPPKAAK
jgi:hypothetical protein